MIIVCPQCESRYELGVTALPEGGRMVRCTRCRAEWMAYPEPEALLGLDDRPAVARAQEPLPEDGELLVEAPPAAGDVLLGEPEPHPETLEEAVARAEAPLRSPKPRSRRAWRPRLGTRPLLLVVSLALPAGILLGRAEIVRAFPSAASLYAHLGLPVNLRGLAIEDVRTSWTREGDVPVLVVEGSVRNLRGEETGLPKLRLAVRDPKGVELYAWTVVLAHSVLEPDAAVSFRGRLAAPPPDGRSVAVRFLRREDMLATPQ